MVVDDEQSVLVATRLVLERAGHTVRCAANGKEAIEELSVLPADVVITDIIMPEQEGIETIRQLRRNLPQIRIIAISGGGRVGPLDYLSAAQMLGADRVFAKPFDNAALVEAVDELCS
jgi:CheY-like chemotaxis protein